MSKRLKFLFLQIGLVGLFMFGGLIFAVNQFPKDNSTPTVKNTPAPTISVEATAVSGFGDLSITSDTTNFTLHFTMASGSSYVVLLKGNTPYGHIESVIPANGEVDITVPCDQLPISVSAPAASIEMVTCGQDQ